MGRRVRQLRKRMKMTQAELAAKVGISTSFMGHIERGTRVASLETLEGLVNALHSSLDYLALDRSSTLSGDTAHMTARMRTLNDLFRVIQEHTDEWFRDD